DRQLKGDTAAKAEALGIVEKDAGAKVHADRGEGDVIAVLERVDGRDRADAGRQVVDIRAQQIAVDVERPRGLLSREDGGRGELPAVVRRREGEGLEGRAGGVQTLEGTIGEGAGGAGANGG